MSSPLLLKPRNPLIVTRAVVTNLAEVPYLRGTGGLHKDARSQPGIYMNRIFLHVGYWTELSLLKFLNLELKRVCIFFPMIYPIQKSFISQ